MSRNSLGFLVRPLVCLSILAASLTVAAAASVDLRAVQFPEQESVQLTFHSTPAAPAGQVSASVEYRRGQARVDLYYSEMKPAILFGGDVTCFVVWAVTRDGRTENLGELLTNKKSGRLTFSTGQKSFALVVTAEAYYLVRRPSELVMFTSGPVAPNVAPSTAFIFDELEPAPDHYMSAIAHLKWDSKVPLELLQARKAFELAGRKGAASYAADSYEQAGQTLTKANEIARSKPKSRDLLDNARRAVALSNEALNISMHRIEAEEMERALAQRRAETEALERRAAEAEESARLVREQRERMLAETVALREEKTGLEAAMIALRQEKFALLQHSEQLSGEKSVIEEEAQRLATEKASLERQAEQLRSERAELQGRLQSALSHVADTQDSARGYVLNLPDILFDVNQDTLKPEAQVVMAKLAGILLLMPDRGVTIEGHTDSTGDQAYNLDLSQRRAVSVMGFLGEQGIDSDRMRATGYGMSRPVAENATADGRRRNRRVEIVISDTSRDRAAN